MEKFKSWDEIFKRKKKEKRVRASPSHPKQVTVLYLSLIPLLHTLWNSWTSVKSKKIADCTWR